MTTNQFIKSLNNNILKRYLIHLSISLLFISCVNKKEVDLIIHNAHILTISEKGLEFEAMVIDNGKIIDLGKENQILNKYSSENQVDCKSAYVYPGFIDAHCHFLSYGLSIEEIDLTGSKSIKEIIDRCLNYSQENKRSIIKGRGWDQNIWQKNNFPNKSLLDVHFPETPVLLSRVDGHALLVNQKALDICGIDINSKVNGGHIEIIDGELTGILTDNAMDLVFNNIPDADNQTKKKALLKAQNKCFELGLTTVDIAGLSKSDVFLIDQLQQSGELKMNIYAMLSDSKENYDYFIDTLQKPYKTKKLNVRSFKFYSDGALGSRGACLLQPYFDVNDSTYYGMMLNTVEHFRESAKKLNLYGYQMCTHCIGDSSARIMLNIYGDVLQGVNDKRWRIEHAQVISPEDYHLFRKYAIIPSVQPTHATSDMLWAVLRLGNKRLKNSYAYQQLLIQNGMIALGTDFPIENINPIHTFYAAVARKNLNGEPKNGFQKDNALTRWEAIQGMTIWAALSNFEENEKGTIEIGKNADFIILNQNLLTVPEKNILNTKVVSTYINGEQVYRH